MKPVIQSISKQQQNENHGWIVVMAASIPLIFLTGMLRISGIIYRAIIDIYEASRSEANIIFITLRLCIYGFTPIASKLSAYYNYSTLISVGGFFMFLSLFLSAFTNSLWQLAIAYGVLIGISLCLTATPGFLAIGVYFKKQRSLALSVYFSIGGAGGLLFPFLLEMLLNNYKLSGAFLIISAIALNICPIAFLIHQPTTSNENSKKSFNQIEAPDVVNETKQEFNEISNNNRRSNSIDSQISYHKTLLKQILINIRPDVSIFKNPSFLVLLISRVLSMIPLLNLLQFSPDLIQGELSVSISQTDIALMLSVTCIGDVCARILVGFIVDRFPWHKKYTYGGTSFIVGILTFMFLFVDSYAMLLSLHIVFGLTMGVIIVVQFVLEGELISTENAALSYGICQAFTGLSCVIMMSVVAYIRDVTGSYVIGFCIMGVCGVCGGLVWCLEPLLKWCLQPIKDQEIRLRKDANEDDENEMWISKIRI